MSLALGAQRGKAFVHGMAYLELFSYPASCLLQHEITLDMLLLTYYGTQCYDLCLIDAIQPRDGRPTWRASR